jgi:sialidase-1
MRRIVGSGAMKITDVEHRVVDIDATREHAYNQVNVRRLRSGELVAVYNEERFPFHHDSGQTVMLRSRDGGETWTDRKVVLPYTDTTGNWDCGICELDDGSLLVDLTIAAYFKRGIRPEQPSWTRGPRTSEHGDWTWSYKTMSWLGAYVLRSADGGATWSEPIPVNARPLKHAGCRLGAWAMPSGSLLLGVYGRIRGYGEEGENE